MSLAGSRVWGSAQCQFDLAAAMHICPRGGINKVFLLLFLKIQLGSKRSVYCLIWRLDGVYCNSVPEKDRQKCEECKDFEQKKETGV